MVFDIFLFEFDFQNTDSTPAIPSKLQYSANGEEFILACMKRDPKQRINAKELLTQGLWDFTASPDRSSSRSRSRSKSKSKSKSKSRSKLGRLGSPKRKLSWSAITGRRPSPIKESEV